MFKISPAMPDEIEWAENYLQKKSDGMIFVLQEDGVKTGAVCFDISDGCGIIERVRVDNDIMKTVTVKAAMNFLDLNAIRRVFVKDDEFENNRGLYEALGFKNTNEGFFLSLDGYFDAEHEKGC